MKPTLPPYVYGRECSENERVLPIEAVQRLIDEAYAAGLEDAASQVFDKGLFSKCASSGNLLFDTAAEIRALKGKA